MPPCTLPTPVDTCLHHRPISVPPDAQPEGFPCSTLPLSLSISLSLSLSLSLSPLSPLHQEDETRDHICNTYDEKARPNTWDVVSSKRNSLLRLMNSYMIAQGD